MTTASLGMLTGVVLLGVFLLSFAAYSLRSFSRSRLEEQCEEADLEARFVEIQKRGPAVLVAVELLRLPMIVGYVIAATSWGRLLIPLTELVSVNDRFDLFMKWMLLLAGLCVAGVVLPIGLSRVAGEFFLLRSWPLLLWIQRLLRPATAITGWIGTLLHRLFDLDEPDPNDPEFFITEIRSIVEAGEATGALNRNAGSMIDQVMELQHADVGSVMTPRTRMCCVGADMTFHDALKAVIHSGHTRLPMIGQSMDDVIGMLFAKDLLKFIGTPPESIPTLRQICREPFYVPETTSIDKLLNEMNRKRQHMAVVLNEYGGIAGLVTMEDLLEEIVGEIVDEYDEVEADRIRRISATVNEVDARVSVSDLVEEFSYELPEERDYDTIAGFTYSCLGRVPVLGEIFEWGTLRFTVLSCDARRIHRLRIELDESLTPVTEEED